MGHALETIDVPRARKNGILQMINGSLCVVFNIAIIIFIAITGDYLYECQRSASGIWGGLFYIPAGALTLYCALRQNVCLGIAALTLNVLAFIVNVVHVIYMSLSIMSIDRQRFVTNFWHDNPEDKIFWKKPIYVVLFR